MIHLHQPTRKQYRDQPTVKDSHLQFDYDDQSNHRLEKIILLIVMVILLPGVIIFELIYNLFFIN